MNEERINRNSEEISNQKKLKDQNEDSNLSADSSLEEIQRFQQNQQEQKVFIGTSQLLKNNLNSANVLYPKSYFSKKLNHIPFWRENFLKLFSSASNPVASSLSPSDIEFQNAQALESFCVFTEGLKKCKSLTFLSLSYIELHTYMVVELAKALIQNTSIKCLDLSGCRISSFALSYLFKSLQLNNGLISLNLFNNQYFTQDNMIDLINYLTYSKHPIQELNLSHCNLQSMALVQLFDALQRTTSLRILDVSLNHLDSKALSMLGVALCSFYGLRYLEELNISYNRIRPEGMKILSEALQVNIGINVKKLNLSHNHIKKEGKLEMCKMLQRLSSNLEYLDISNNNLKSLQGLQVESMKKLKVLNASGNQLRNIPRKLYSMYSLQENNRIKKKMISQNGLYHSLLRSLYNERGQDFFPRLKVLNLSNNKIGFKGALSIAYVLKNCDPVWQELNLNDNQIFSEGFNAIIYALRENSYLLSLSIARNSLDGESIICAIVNHDRLALEYLDLSGNQIRYQILFILLNLLKNCQLRSLILGNMISDVEDQSLFIHKPRFALSCQSLVELDFHGNVHISCWVLASLSSHFNRLQKLSLKNCYPVHERDLVYLGNYIKGNDYLHDLNISGLRLGVLSCQILEKFAQNFALNQTLNRLDLSKNILVDHLELFLKQISQCNSLEYLDLSYNHINKRNLNVLSHLTHLGKKLANLRLDHNKISLESLISIANRKNSISQSGSSSGAIGGSLTKNYSSSPTIKSKMYISSNQSSINNNEKQLSQFNRTKRPSVFSNTQNIQLFNTQTQNLWLKSLSLQFAYITGDDLKILGLLLRNSQNNTDIQSIDLTGNQKIMQYCTFLKQSENLIDKIIYNNCFLSSTHYYYLFKQNYISLTQISIYNCIFYLASFKDFCRSIAFLPYIKQFELVQVPLSKSNIVKIIEPLKMYKYLKILKLVYLNLSKDLIYLLYEILLQPDKKSQSRGSDCSNFINNYNFTNSALGSINQNNTNSMIRSCNLAQQSQPTLKLDTLDMSHNVFKADWLSHLSRAIKLNRHIKNLIVDQIQCSEDEFNLFLENIVSTESIKYLSIASNGLNWKYNFNVNNLNISCINISNYYNLGNELVFQSIIQTIQQFQKLTALNLQKSLISTRELIIIKENNNNLQNIQALNLSQNIIFDSGAILLDQIIMALKNLKELYVAGNKFSAVGFQHFIPNLYTNSSLRVLDISQNQGSDKLAQILLQMIKKKKNQMACQGVNQAQDKDKLKSNEIPLNENYQFDQLEFLYISENQFTKEANQYLIQLLEVLKNQVFIDCNWCLIENNLGELVITQYAYFYQKYRIIQEYLPKQLKRISLVNCCLDDQFCFVLARNYCFFKFTEVIDLRGNPNISSTGKIFLYLHLFDQRCDFSRLIQIYIDDFSNNDGLKQILSKKKKKSSIKKDLEIQKINLDQLKLVSQNSSIMNLGIGIYWIMQIVDRFNESSFILRLAMRLLHSKYLKKEIFKYDYTIIQSLQQLDGRFDLISIIFFAMLIIQYMIQFMTFFRRQREIENHSLLKPAILLNIILSFLLALVQLIVSLILRKNQNQIFDQNSKRNQKKSVKINQLQECKLFFYSLVLCFDTFLDYFIFNIILSRCNLPMIIITAFPIIFKAIPKYRNLFTQIYTRYKQVIIPKEDIAIFLMQLWQFFLIQGFLNYENLLINIAPINAVHIFKIKLNFKSYFQIKCFLFELIIFIMLMILILEYEQEHILIYIAIFKSIILILFNLCKGICFSPSTVQQINFDELLNIQRYKEYIIKQNQTQKDLIYNKQQDLLGLKANRTIFNKINYNCNNENLGLSQQQQMDYLVNLSQCNINNGEQENRQYSRSFGEDQKISNKTSFTQFVEKNIIQKVSSLPDSVSAQQKEMEQQVMQSDLNMADLTFQMQEYQFQENDQFENDICNENNNKVFSLQYIYSKLQCLEPKFLSSMINNQLDDDNRQQVN